MDARRQHLQELPQSRSLNNLVSPEARKKKLPVKQLLTNIRKGPLKMRCNGTSSLHRVVVKGDRPCQILSSSQNKIEKEKFDHGRIKRPSGKHLSRTNSSEKLRPKKHQAVRTALDADELEGYSDFDEYFLFDNRIIPIVNSDEKRVVNRYINDSMSTQDKEWKQMDHTCDGLHSKKEVKDCQVMTEARSLGERFTQTECLIRKTTASQQTLTDPLPVVVPVQKVSIAVSAKPQPIPPPTALRKEREEPTFDEVLSKLQFLYLPEQRHFQNLTHIQRQHYKDLFLMLAEKLTAHETPKLQQPSLESMEQSALLFHQLNHEIALMIQERIAQQMSCGEMMSEEGIPTSLVSIIGYLSNLFCFIDSNSWVDSVKYKEVLLKGVNTPYGLYNNERFYMVSHGKKPSISNDTVLVEGLYEQFERQFVHF